jgi:cytochrome c
MRRVEPGTGTRLGRRLHGVAAPLVLALAALATPSAFADEALAKSSGCMGCHAINQKVLGPTFVEVAQRHAKAPDAAAAVAAVARSITVGQKGSWGEIPMPPQTHVSAKDAEILARWVLSQKGN